MCVHFKDLKVFALVLSHERYNRISSEDDELSKRNGESILNEMGSDFKVEISKGYFKFDGESSKDWREYLESILIFRNKIHQETTVLVQW